MKKAYSIVASIGLDDSKKDLPEWYLIFEEGRGEVEGEEKYIVDETSFNVVKAGLDRRGIEIVVDYEHQTLKDTKAPASGWCRDWRYTKGLGIEAKVVWTEEAAEYLKKGEYRYFSPVFYVRKSDKRLSAVHSLALTNAPRTNHLKPLLAKLGAEEHPKKEKTMDLLKIMIAALKLDANATEDQVVAKVKELLKKKDDKTVVAKIPTDVTNALGLNEDDSVSTVVASIHALHQTTKNSVSQEEFNKLQNRLNDRDADEVVAKAMTDGKITPDQKEWADKYARNDLEGFKTFVAKAPVVIHTDPLERETTPPAAELNSDVLQVAKLMDVSEDDLKKYGGVQ